MALPVITEAEVPQRLVPVVLGGDVLAYSYARCFNEAYGIKTVILSGVDVRVTSSSRFTDYCVAPEMNEDSAAIASLLRRLGEEWVAAGKVPVLLGSADWHVRVICEHACELSDLYVIPYNSFEVLDDITQKGRFYQICEELGMAYPKTWTFDCSDPDAVIDAESFTYPLIAKPSNSARYDLMDFPGKEKIYEVHEPAELTRIFNLLRDAGYDKELVVQDFIPGDDDAICSLTTFSDAQGVVRAVSGGRVVLQDHSPARIGNPVTILLERHEQLIEDAKRFCAHTGYVGFANFDAKYDERDGMYKFFEVNARPGANTYYMTVGGVNFAALIVETFVLGRDVPYTEAYREALYTLVPTEVIKRCVPNDELRAKTLDLYVRHLAFSPFDAPGDTWAHKLWAHVRCRRQIKKFQQHMGDVVSAKA